MRLIIFSCNFILKPFFSGSGGIGLTGEYALLQKISKHYYTEEATRYLANLLLADDDYSYVKQKLGQRKMTWSNIAELVMFEWKNRVSQPNSLTLLCAMEKSNKDAADFFRKTLDPGEYPFLLFSAFVRFRQYGCLTVPLSLPLTVFLSLCLTSC